ncbi:hypothetical protein CapIbe_016823 [Capra ibex]
MQLPSSYKEALRSYLHHHPTRALLNHHRKQPTACSGKHYRKEHFFHLAPSCFSKEVGNLGPCPENQGDKSKADLQNEDFSALYP